VSVNKKQWLLALMIMFSMLLPVSAAAEFISGVELKKWCESADPTDKSSCLAYILGVNDMLEKVSEGKQQKVYCLPAENFSSSLLYESVLVFLAENQKHIHRSAAVNTLLALQKTYPCH